MPGLVGPVVLGVGDDGGNVGVRELLPGRHGTVGLAVEQHRDLLGLVGIAEPDIRLAEPVRVREDETQMLGGAPEQAVRKRGRPKKVLP